MGLTSTEAAKILKLTRRQVAYLCEQGKLSARKHGRDWDIDLDSVKEYASKPRKPGPPKGQGGRPRKK